MLTSPRKFLQALAFCVASVGAAVAIAAGLPGGQGSPELTLLADGAISISDSRNGEAIVTADTFAPGASASGTVTISNTGTAPGALSLRAGESEDDFGQNGGVLSTVLELEVTDITGGSDAPVFAGGLDEMPPQELLSLPGGGERTYRFLVTMPDGGTPPSDYSGDNRFQRASSRFAYEWTLSGDGSPSGPCGNQLRGDGTANRLVGTELGDRISGLGGRDRINALAGEDCVDGGGGADAIRGGAGGDTAAGRSGNDFVSGGPGADVARGGSGDDRMTGGPGRDSIYGGSGNDWISVRGGGADFVSCGAGNDHVILGWRDIARRC